MLKFNELQKLETAMWKRDFLGRCYWYFNNGFMDFYSNSYLNTLTNSLVRGGLVFINCFVYVTWKWIQNVGKLV